MGFRDNSTLITSAHTVNLVADGAATVYTGTAGADSFVIADGSVGDDVITGFGSNDTIITGKKIFDGNGDGYIAFGPGATLDVDRYGSGDSRKGDDNISVVGGGEDNTITEIRYLGTKDGGFVYAESGTRDDLLGRFTSGFQSTNGGADSSITQNLKIDNDVADNTFNFGTTSVALLTDNALGLNFGGDVINGFGDDDLLVFTSKLYNKNDGGTGDGANILTFGKNLVLDLSGSEGPMSSDPSTGPGGQFGVSGYTSIHYLGEKTIGDSTYFYYGTAGSDTPAGVHI